MKLKLFRQRFLEKLTEPINIIGTLIISYLLICSMIFFISKIVPVYVIIEYYPLLKLIFENIKGVWETQAINDMFKYLLPLTLTVYTFSYREKKQFAPSSINGISESIKLYSFVVLALSSYFYGVFIKDKGFVTESIPFFVDVWWLSVVLAFIMLIFVWQQAFNNIDETKLLNTKMKQLQKEINDLKDSMHSWDISDEFEVQKDAIHNLIEKKEKRLHSQIESIYQILGYMNKNNMNEMFIKNLKAITVPIRKFNSKKFWGDERKIYINKEKMKVIERIYTTFCVNHVALISKLFSENKISKANLALDIFTENLKPDLKNKALDTRFNMCINELILNYQLDDMQKLRMLLDALQTLGRGKIERIYESLICICIENKNLKAICNIVYPVTGRIKDVENFEEETPSTRMIQAIQFGIIQKDIHLIMKAIVKSIELGHHECTGFLVKFLITRYKTHYINQAINSFRRVNAILDLDFTEDEQESVTETDRNSVGFKFNPDTLDYCIYKMFILIYAQQKYIAGNNIEIVEKNGSVDVTLPQILEKCKHVDYILDKIKNRESSYGLLFIKNQKYMNRLKRDLGRLNKSS